MPTVPASVPVDRTIPPSFLRNTHYLNNVANHSESRARLLRHPLVDGAFKLVSANGTYTSFYLHCCYVSDPPLLR